MKKSALRWVRGITHGAGILLLTSGLASAEPLLKPSEVPDPLKTWIPWATQDDPARACPFDYNTLDVRRCLWPGEASFQLSAQGGTFSYRVQTWRALNVALPGDGDAWPQQVKVNNAAAVVVGQDRPMMALPAGQHVITGSFVWKQLPEAVALPSEVALIRLSVNGKAIEAPEIGAKGELLLQRDASDAQSAEVSQEVRVYRLIFDGVPTFITTRIELAVSGKPREVRIPAAQVTGFVAMQLTSKLPAKLDPDGALKVQARAGKWMIELVSRAVAPVKTITLPAAAKGDEASNRDELWSFAERGNIRAVTVSGVTAVDPATTTLPQDWRRFPTYGVRAGETLTFTETRRGDPEPNPNQLTAVRQLWLDFDGGGYTLQDRLTGAVNRGWRLELAAPFSLGRAEVNGAPQFITKRSAQDASGFEVREARAAIVADARLDSDTRTLPASGWSDTVQGLTTSLHVPPGWRLWHASGADRVSGSWITQWTLLDLFLLLVLALAFSQLYGRKWGAVALVAIALSFHEGGAPVAWWIPLLVFSALERYVPAKAQVGWVYNTIRVLRWLSVIAIAMVLVVYATRQFRVAIHPVLETAQSMRFMGAVVAQGREDAEDGDLNRSFAAKPMQAEDVRAEPPPPPPPLPAPAAPPAPMVKAMPTPPAEAASAAESRYQGSFAPKGRDKRDDAFMRNQRFDAKTNIQTGPGLPTWSWKMYQLTWSGPVDATQSVSLWLTRPPVNAVLNVLRVLLLATLLWVVLRGGRGNIGKPGLGFGTSTPAADLRAATTRVTIVLALLSAVLPTNDVVAQDKQSTSQTDQPSGERLSELKAKLISAPDCLPACAQIARLQVNANGNALLLVSEVHAQPSDPQAAVAVPLPNGGRQSAPTAVLVNGKPAAALMRSGPGEIWIALPRGVHTVSVASALNNRDEVSIALPLRPRRVESQVNGWALNGVQENGVPDTTLQLSRNAGDRTAAAAGTATQGNELPPFFTVLRTLNIGLQWEVTTIVQRSSPLGTAVSVQVPLLPGESIAGSEPRVVDGKAQVSFAPQAQSTTWTSTLTQAPVLKLAAATDAQMIEEWMMDLGPQWHATSSGIAPTSHTRGGRWSPTWQPWPGESVTLTFARPTGIEGRTLTLDSSMLALAVGQRATDATLTFNARSSLGATHSITLPERSELLSVAINNTTQPIKPEGRTLKLPISPGAQRIDVKWREPLGAVTYYNTPDLNLGVTSVNAHTQIKLPQERWILAVGGSRMGPAVLMWGVVAALVGVAIALGIVSKRFDVPVKHWQWFVLGLGFTQTPLIASALIVAWLFLLAVRKRFGATLSRMSFNALQLLLAFATFVAFWVLVFAVHQGLLGYPEMHIRGNGSSAALLHWFTDRAEAAYPTSWVLSVSLMVYRGLMLLWALWLAVTVLRWVKWGWQCFSEGGLWKRAVRTAAANPPAAPPAAQA